MSSALHSGKFCDLFYLNTRLLSRKLCSPRLFPFGNEKEVAFTPLPPPFLLTSWIPGLFVIYVADSTTYFLLQHSVVRREKPLKSLVTFSQTLYPIFAVEAHILRYLPYINSVDKPNFRPKTDTRSPRNKGERMRNLRIWNWKKCVCSYVWFKSLRHVAMVAKFLNDNKPKRRRRRRRRRRYFYLARVTPTVTKTDILRGPR